MVVVRAFGSKFELRVRSSTGLEKEEFQKDGETYICSEVGEEFKLVVVRTVEDGRTPCVECVARLDGENSYAYFSGAAGQMVYHGWWIDGTRFKAFQFGAPSEEAMTNQFDNLKMELWLYEVVKGGERPPTADLRVPNMDHNKVKKPFQPNVSVGRDLVLPSKGNVTRYTYRRITVHPVVVGLRYKTAIGLELLRIISRQSHPALFVENRNGDDDDDDEKHDKKNIPLNHHHPDVVDLTKVKAEMPPTKKQCIGGRTKDDPIDLC